MLEKLKTLLLSTGDFREIEFDGEDFRELLAPVSYTHLTLPTIA